MSNRQKQVLVWIVVLIVPGAWLVALAVVVWQHWKKAQ
jgi:hypothetical protein